MSYITDVERYIREHPGSDPFSIAQAFEGRYTYNTVWSAIVRLYGMHIITSERGYVDRGGHPVRTYLYTHVMTYRGGRDAE